MLLFWGSVCIWVSSVVGGATGFGAALVAAPFMLLAGFSVEDVVIINLVAGIVTRIGVSLRLWSHISWRRVALLVAGSLPGAWLGALLALAFPEHELKRAVGIVVVVCGVGMAVMRLQKPYVPSTRAQVAAGFVSGYLSTTTSLNGPPIVLLLARAGLPPLLFIADLAAYFTVTNALSLLILLGRGPVPADIFWPDLPVLVAVAMVGNFLGLRIVRKLPAHGFRTAVIGLVIFVGMLTVIVA
ncbi:sulfite exporter TauE/SafE family protein [Mycobacterium sp. 21AC1]|uniref:sulfite exporter TauE/SafE family protein n=1 Tax=[Mycobacterium] appelbergii TaxID=2939269 RepID=UPI00293921C7|nr:sulfite exporter TauE/SafE family protein [Mycobacterium sp. 21AC1]MDV3123490.1 sulfite exporter TauE/SafE family protein [Mycobacterium sp. 21AC1]